MESVQLWTKERKIPTPLHAQRELQVLPNRTQDSHPTTTRIVHIKRSLQLAVCQTEAPSSTKTLQSLPMHTNTPTFQLSKTTWIKQLSMCPINFKTKAWRHSQGPSKEEPFRIQKPSCGHVWPNKQENKQIWLGPLGLKVDMLPRHTQSSTALNPLNERKTAMEFKDLIVVKFSSIQFMQRLARRKLLCRKPMIRNLLRTLWKFQEVELDSSEAISKDKLDT
jgi:hypothetical protein